MTLCLKESLKADEVYIGGKPRYRERTRGRPKPKAGRGTNKASVIGVIERGGRVVAELAYDISGRTIRNFLLKNIKKEETVLMTDEYRSYNIMDNFVERHVIKHTERRYVDGEVHTNTIEGFWSEVKRAFHGNTSLVF